MPTLPSKTLLNNNSDNTTEYRQHSFQDFLSFVTKHKILVNSPELLAFLRLPDTEFEKFREVNKFTVFIQPAKEFMCKGKSKDLSQVASPSGVIEGRLDSTVRKLARDISVLIVDTFGHFEEAASLCREAEDLLSKLAVCYNKLANETEAIACKFNLVAEVDKFTPYGKLGELYAAMSDTFFIQATVARDESVNFGAHFTRPFDFDLKEVEGLEEVAFLLLKFMVKRNEFSNEYKDQKAELMKKKEAAFASKDLKKWEVDQEKLPVTMLEMSSNKETAMRYMFTHVIDCKQGLKRHQKPP